MRRILAWSQSLSVRVKILGLAVAVAVMMGAGGIVVARAALLSAARTELEQHAVAVATSLAVRSVEPVLTHGTFGLYQLVTSVRQGDADIRYAFVVDGTGRVAAHTFGTGFPQDLLKLPPPPADVPYLSTPVETEEGLVHDVAVPLLGGQFGYVRVGLTEGRVQEAALGLTTGMIQAILAVAGLAVLAALALTSLLTRPLQPLVALTQAVATGDFSRRAPAGPPDEFGRLTSAFNGMVQALGASRKEVLAKEKARQELLERVITAQEDERRRISRELHDEAGQSLTALTVGLRSLMDEHPGVSPRAEPLRQLAHGTLEGLRHLSVELRPQALDDLGLAAAVRRYVDDFGAAHGLEVQLQVLGPESVPLPPALATCFYRIIQESLTNIARHAKARRVSVVLNLRPGTAIAIIEDDGVGFTPEEYLGNVRPDGSGLGLLGIQERVNLAGGTLDIESSPGQGTSIFVKCPYSITEAQQNLVAPTAATSGVEGERP